MIITTISGLLRVLFGDTDKRASASQKLWLLVVRAWAALPRPLGAFLTNVALYFTSHGHARDVPMSIATFVFLSLTKLSYFTTDVFLVCGSAEEKAGL